MTPTFPFSERVPLNAVERMQRNFEAFLQTIRTGLGTTVSATQETMRWQKAHDLLAKEYTELESEADMFRAGRPEPLLRHCSELRFLVKRMDGYSLSFAGEAEKTLAAQRQLLVLVAWQITAAANGSEAAGL